MTTVFTFRVGPIRADEIDVYLYVLLADDTTFAVVDALDDAEGLCRVVA